MLVHNIVELPRPLTYLPISRRNHSIVCSVPPLFEELRARNMHVTRYTRTINFIGKMYLYNESSCALEDYFTIK